MSEERATVVVVEDEPDLADLYTAWLDDDYDVHAAYGGEEALELIDDLGAVDVVLLDRRMPEVSGDEVLSALRDRGLAVTHAAPPGLDDVFASVPEIGAAIGRPADGERLAVDLRDRVDAVRAAVPDDPSERPVVYAEEWGDPPMAAGNWVPEAVAAAGGRCPFVSPGERSHEIEAAAVEREHPDHAVFHWCGADREPAWTELRDRGWAVDPVVHVLDDSLLNQPSPRLVDGIETLAELLHGSSVPADSAR